MRKKRYYYNPTTCSYEPVQTSLWSLILSGCLFIFCAVVVALIMVDYYHKHGFKSPREVVLQEDNQRLKDYYHTIEQKIAHSAQLLITIQERDDALYRVLLGREPLSITERNAGIGGVDKYAHLSKEYLIAQTLSKVDQLINRLKIQKKSYDDILSYAHKKNEKFKSMPTFPPLSKKHLKRMSSGFGMRIDPILGVHRMHEGIDFAAPKHTPIYAVADGQVKWVKISKKGYGNALLLDHGNGFRTLYAHMHTITISERQRVKRGEQIGAVGDTGHARGDHLHYEVHHNKRRIDPLLYLVEGLTHSEYEEICRQAAQPGKTMCYSRPE